MDKIFKCVNCNIYTLNSICKICGNITVSTKPAKFSLEDKYGKYRRLAKWPGK